MEFGELKNVTLREVWGHCQRSFKFPPPAVIENSPTPWLIKR